MQSLDRGKYVAGMTNVGRTIQDQVKETSSILLSFLSTSFYNACATPNRQTKGSTKPDKYYKQITMWGNSQIVARNSVRAIAGGCQVICHKFLIQSLNSSQIISINSKLAYLDLVDFHPLLLAERDEIILDFFSLRTSSGYLFV